MRKQLEDFSRKLKQVDKRYWIAIGGLSAALLAAAFIFKMASLPIELAKAQNQAQTSSPATTAPQQQTASAVDPFAESRYPVSAPVAIWLLAYDARGSAWAQISALPIGTYDVCALYAHIDYRLVGGADGRWKWEVANRAQPVVITNGAVANGLPFFDCAGVVAASQAATQKLPTKAGA